MTLKKILLTTAVAVVPVLLAAQGQPQGQATPPAQTVPAAQAASAPTSQAQSQGGLDPAAMLKPLAEEWTSYSGDYTGRRYSTLTQVNQTNVKNLTLAWVSKLTAGAGNAGGGGGFGGGRGGFGGAAPVIVGGEGSGEFAAGGNANIKGAILQVGGVLYISAPDNAWAIDARDPGERQPLDRGAIDLLERAVAPAGVIA